MSNRVNSTKTDKTPCAISGREWPRRQLVNLETIRPSLAERIRRDHPDLAQDALIGRPELARYRSLYVEELLQRRKRRSFRDRAQGRREPRDARDARRERRGAEYEEKRTFGERLSDHLASFGGSWSFLIIFGVSARRLDRPSTWRGQRRAPSIPIPSSCSISSSPAIAAIQAPIIMMSQKRQEAKDRLRSLNDYQVNLKAELEIRHLHEKIDHLINKQWQRLAEIQQLQLEIMQDRRR